MSKQIHISIPVSIFKEKDTFVAYTPALDISTCATTLAETKQQFTELINLFFEELERNNTTNEVLESMGWQKINKSWSPPVEVEHSVESFEVPTCKQAKKLQHKNSTLQFCSIVYQNPF